MSSKVLVVDDDQSLGNLLKEVLETQGHEVLLAPRAEDALSLLERETVDVVISDERMPGMSGSEFLTVVNRKYPDTIRIILTGYASLDGAIRAINEGEIYRFFTKPCNPFDLAVTVRQALQQRALVRESRKLLRIARRQKAFIEELEEKYPGLTLVEKDETGQVIIGAESSPEDPDSLIREIEEILAHYGTGNNKPV